MSNEPTAEPIEVVAAVRRLIRRDETKYWICRRTDDGRHGGLKGLWEYPGGKVEEFETCREALRREMREEFEVEITFMETAPLASIVATAPWYNGTQEYRVTFFAIDFVTEPVLHVHDQAKWCTVEELKLDKHLPSGVEFNKRLLATCAGERADGNYNTLGELLEAMMRDVYDDERYGRNTQYRFAWYHEEITRLEEVRKQTDRELIDKIEELVAGLADRFAGEEPTALRMQRVAEGHVSSLEAHLEAIKGVVGAYDSITSCARCQKVRDIISGAVNIFNGPST